MPLNVDKDRCCRNPFSRVGHTIFVSLYLLIFVLSICSLVVFILKDQEINREQPDGSEGDCILYVDEEQIERGDIGGGDFCGFAIFGMATVAVVAAIYLLLFTVKCLFGARLLSCAILVEIPLIFCAMVISLSHSLNSTIGLALTCQAFEDAGINSGSRDCSEYEAPGETKFYEELLAAEALSWTVTVILSVLFIVNIIMGILFWKKATRPKRQQRADQQKS